ncbi:MAG: OmpA family protein [Parafilimonas sp.]
MKKNGSGKKHFCIFFIKYFLASISIIVFCSISSAQTYNPDNVNKKAQDVYVKALMQLNDGEAKDAIPLLTKAIELDKNYEDAYLSLGGVYGEIKNYQKSAEYYENARNIDAAYFKFFNLSYSINLAGLGRFQDALNAVNEFLSMPKLNEKSIKSANYRKQCYEFAVNYAATHPQTNYVFAPVNLGDNINSVKAEYYPSFTIDDSTFVFTRRGEGIREDFMQSTLHANGYSKAEVIKGDINNQPSKGAINISQDGEWLIFAGNFPGQGNGDFDLYISFNTPTGWSEPFNLGNNINTEFWESSPSLSPDKNALYFSSNRPGGYGGRDLYVSYREANGKWSPAENMGPTINSVGDELAPFIHADNHTLFYTSNGLPGYGGTDTYVLHKGPNNQWSKPENLGFPVNTIEDEGSLFIASDGVTAYYASDRSDTRGQLDLYRFELKPEMRPAKTLYVKGYVTDAITKKGIPSSVELSDDSTRQIVTNLQTDETGFYFITLPVGRNYTFTVNRKGYLFYADVFGLKEKSADSTYEKNISLQPIAVNESVTFRNVQFELNSYTLQPVSIIELDKLVQLMTDNPTIKVQLSGHTDNTGNAADNLKLSENRAKAVADYLISKGIDAKRLTWKGYGETKPVADNFTEEGRAKNRRTEFTIIGM